MDIFEKIAFTKLNSIVSIDVVEQEPVLNIPVITFAHEMSNLGFSITKQVYNYLCNLKNPKEKCADILEIAKESVGAHVRMKAFYPDFPLQVMNMAEADLYFLAAIHYWSCGYWKPSFIESSRPELKEVIHRTNISLISIKHVKAYFFKILSSKQSVPEALVTFVDAAINEGWACGFNGEIPFKENLCRVATFLVKKGESINNIISTSTDILRVMASLSDSDIELKKKIRFKSLSRKYRRIIMLALEKVINISDIKAYESLWKIAFHSLHVGEFGGKTADIASCFRNENNVKTSETIIAEAIKNGNTKLAMKKLINKPSVFARSLDKLLRDSNKETGEFIIKQFASIINKIDAKILLQLFGHFKGRKINESSSRIVFTAGSQGRAILVPKLTEMDNDIVRDIMNIITIELEKQFCNKGHLKNRKVYIGIEAKGVLLPSQLASISDNKRTISRGSRVPIDIIPSDIEKNTLRMFIHWIGDDIDLSALFLSEDLNTQSHIAFTNLKDGFAWHSGDIVNAPGPDGASEFIDIDLKKAQEFGKRYVCMDVRVFKGPSFLEHEQCFAGFMLRKEPESGEIFEPSTVRCKFDITSKGRSADICLFDMETREMIWIDTMIKHGKAANSLVNNTASSVDIIRAFLKMEQSKTNINELVSMHARAVDANIVSKRDEADFTVGLGEGDLDVYDFTTINADWI